MHVTINGKEYPIHIGLDCIDYLNRIYYIEQNGVKISQGINLALTELYMQNPVALLHMIKAGTITEQTGPGTKEIKDFLETEADYEVLFEDFLEALRTAHATRRMVQTVETQMQEATRKLPGSRRKKSASTKSS